MSGRPTWPFSTLLRDHSTARPCPGALEALARIGEVADIVVLTNLDTSAWLRVEISPAMHPPPCGLQQGGTGRASRTSWARRTDERGVHRRLGVHHSSVSSTPRRLSTAHGRRAAARGRRFSRRAAHARLTSGRPLASVSLKSSKGSHDQRPLDYRATAGIVADSRGSFGRLLARARTAAAAIACGLGGRNRRDSCCARADVRDPDSASRLPGCRRRGSTSYHCSTTPAASDARCSTPEKPLNIQSSRPTSPPRRIDPPRAGPSDDGAAR